MRLYEYIIYIHYIHVECRYIIPNTYVDNNDILIINIHIMAIIPQIIILLSFDISNETLFIGLKKLI